MGPIFVRCLASTWQEDFATVAPRVYRYYRGATRHFNDPDEAAQEAICFVMEEFRRKWAPGTMVPVWTRRALLSALQGRRFVRRSELGYTRQMSSVRPIRSVSPEDAAVVRHFARYTDRDAVLDAGQLSARHGAVCRLLLAGYSVKRICRVIGAGDRTAARMVAEIARHICFRSGQ